MSQPIYDRDTLDTMCQELTWEEAAQLSEYIYHDLTADPADDPEAEKYRQRATEWFMQRKTRP
jgi:hypothetical protein